MSSIGNDIYNLSNGSIKIGSLETGKESGGWVKNLTQAALDYSIQGTRDRENNAIYDNHVRMKKTMAVLSAVGYTHEEAKAQNTYKSINFNDSNTRASFERMGIIKNSAQNNANTMLNNATFSFDSGKQAGQTFKDKNNKPLRINNFNEDQLAELAVNGTFHYTFIDEKGVQRTEVLKLANQDKSTTRTVLQEANKEKKNNYNLAHVKGNVEKRAALAKIKTQQIKYLKQTSFTGHFDGSIHSARQEIKAIDNKQKSLRNNLINVTNPKEKEKIKAEINKLENSKKDFETFINTGANYESNGRNLRHYGRQVIVSSIMGSEMNQGYVFYKTGTKLAVNTTKLAARTVVAAGTGTVSLATAIPRKVAANTKVGKTSEKINDMSQKFKTDVNESFRKKSKEEKKNIKADKKTKREDARLNRINKKTDKINQEFKEFSTLNLSKSEERTLKKLQEKSKKGYKLSAKESQQLTDLLNKKNFKVLTGTQADKYNKMLQKKTNRENRLKFLSKHGERYRKFRTRLNSAFKTVTKYAGAPFRAVNKVAEVIINPFRKIGGLVKKIALGATLAFFGLILNGLFICLIITVIASLFDSLQSVKIAQELAEINYVQLIVNDTANDLGREITNTAINDAETHFLSEGHTIKSNGYTWNKAVSEGSIKHIWATEDLVRATAYREELAGVSANLVPIVSMMHYRYNDEIDFDNYLTAKGYIYFMYVRSHQIAPDDSGNAYSYEELADCDSNNLYSIQPSYDTNSSTVSRGKANCTNVYVHGYTVNYSKKVNEARAGLGKFLTKVIGELGLPPVFEEENGVFIDKIPYDSDGQCNNYKTFKAGNSESFTKCGITPHNHYQSGCTRSYYRSDGSKCYTEEHTHSDEQECYDSVIISYDGACPYGGTHEEKDNADNNKGLSHDDPNYKESCYEYQEQIYQYYVDYSCGHTWVRLSKEDYESGNFNKCPEHHDNDWERGDVTNAFPVKHDVKVMTCNGHHNHDERCIEYERTLICEKEEHNHQASGEHEDWDCHMQEHEHAEWHSEQDPGCWKTAYVCMGHCGGHISPTINLSLDMSLNTLMCEDGYKTTYFLEDPDFINIRKDGFKTIDDWQNHWIAKCKTWFFPFPTNPLSAYEWAGKKIFTTGLKFSEWITGVSYKKDDIKDEDVFDFEGWTEQVNGHWQTKEGILEDMHALYGDYNLDRYKEAIDNFKEFDVTFPSAFNASLGTDTIKDTISEIKSKNGSISESKEKLLNIALHSIGSFYYSESKDSPDAHKNGIYGTKVSGQYEAYGPSDKSGFIIGIARRADIENGGNGDLIANMNVSDFYNNGYSMSNKSPGDIICNERGDIAIYLGLLDKGIKGYKLMNSNSITSVSQNKRGYYIIECSKEYGGACVRNISSSELQKYTRCYKLY